MASLITSANGFNAAGSDGLAAGGVDAAVDVDEVAVGGVEHALIPNNTKVDTKREDRVRGRWWGVG